MTYRLPWWRTQALRFSLVITPLAVVVVGHERWLRWAFAATAYLMAPDAWRDERGARWGGN